jgi:hypothetical protein
MGLTRYCPGIGPNVPICQATRRSSDATRFESQLVLATFLRLAMYIAIESLDVYSPIRNAGDRANVYNRAARVIYQAG